MRKAMRSSRRSATWSRRWTALRSPVDVWTPLRPSRQGEGGNANYQVVARLKAGVPWSEAAAQLRSLDPRLMEGADGPRGAALEQRLMPLDRAVTGEIRGQVLLVW